MTNRPDVDATRLGVLGICGGGGFAIKAAQTEHRFKAVATLSMVDLGQLRRDGLNGVLKPRMQEHLDEVGMQRTLEANGEPNELFSVDGASHIDLYYKPEFVDQVIKKLNDFYEKKL